MTIGSELLFADAIFDRHPFCHELGHNFGLMHGGLMGTIVEAARFRRSASSRSSGCSSTA